MECESNHFLPRAHHIRKKNMGILDAGVAIMMVRGRHSPHGNSINASSRVSVLCPVLKVNEKVKKARPYDDYFDF